MGSPIRFYLLLLAAPLAAAAPQSGDEINRDMDAQVCAAAVQTILAASPREKPAISFVPGGDATREGCIAAALERAGRILVANDSADVLLVRLRGDEVRADRFLTRLSLSSYDASDSAWTHAGRLEFRGSAAHWRFSHFVIDRFIDGRRVR